MRGDAIEQVEAIRARLAALATEAGAARDVRAEIDVIRADLAALRAELATFEKHPPTAS